MKIFSKWALVALFAAFTVVSCMDGSYDQNFSGCDDFDYQDFAHDYPDSVFKTGFFRGTTGMTVYNMLESAESFTGGMAISMKCDPLFGADHKTRSPFCVADTTGAKASPKAFAVYYQNPVPEKNPKYDIVYSNDNGICTALSAQICNTNLVANLIKYGNEEIPAFKEGDYLKLTFKAYLNEKPAGSKTFDLAKYEGSLSVTTDWRQVDIAEVGDFNGIDLILSSNRPDLPLYCCIDEFCIRVIISQ